MSSQLNKTYDPTVFEGKVYERWDKSGAFSYKKSTEKKRSYVVMMPPPNVTGHLHMGHALTYSIQDVLVRFHRMRGFDTLWQPGTDHAGIATQMVVERQLEKEGKTRHDLGRDAFLDRVWDWKEESGDAIINQQKRLGVSADWSRQRFTMDEGLSESVVKVFVSLYNEGLIYRGSRLVNWDPKMQTAVSDLEVTNVESQGSLWYLRYPLVEEEGRFICVATTRPETLFGDMAVAVHPEDDRYKDLIGNHVYLPLTDRAIPIISDEYSDPEKGSGAVKITPAHDFNDFEVGQRHSLEMLTILDENAFLNEKVPEDFQGLSRETAREKVVKALQEKGLLGQIEETIHMVPHGERSGIILEPRLTKQWFVEAKTLAAPALDAVKKGDTSFIPDRWKNTYFEWLNTIQPWCISRQIWWGHRIPAWYGPDGKIFVAPQEEEAKIQAKEEYGKDVVLTQDPDVLDTWFSSALWPFSTLGWPEKTDILRECYPTSTLVTGFDIIFFWVARMMMMGLHFMGKIPFKHIYMHALVRDSKGQKMSKTRGNVVDPLELTGTYGADALRFSLLFAAAPGRDVRFSVDQVEAQRNFATKLWNAARFCQHYECDFKGAVNLDLNALSHPVNRWIVNRAQEATRNITDHLESHRLDLAANALYHFIWSEFCDWYLELSKPLLQEGSQEQIEETRLTAPWVLQRILKLLHPFMPFITEELWQTLFAQEDVLLMLEDWPEDTLKIPDEKGVSWLVGLVTALRRARSEVNVPAGEKVPLLICAPDEKSRNFLESYKLFLQRLARINSFREVSSLKDQKSCVQVLHEGTTYALPLAEIIDIDAEKARLEKALKQTQKEVMILQGKLGNASFVDKAPPEVVAKNQERLKKEQEVQAKLEAALRDVS
ncbi:MAG: valine--tRNA ligase [bacterium]|nr:valine--tRNA ligase [bacterium]